MKRQAREKLGDLAIVLTDEPSKGIQNRVENEQAVLPLSNVVGIARELLNELALD